MGIYLKKDRVLLYDFILKYYIYWKVYHNKDRKKNKKVLFICKNDLWICIASYNFFCTVYLKLLNTPFSIKEIEDVIKAVPHNKLPGPDSFTTGYYRLFSALLSPSLERVHSAAVSTASFPFEMVTATIALLPKPGKEPVSAQSFKPISL